MADPSAGPIPDSTQPEDGDTEIVVVTYFMEPEDDDGDEDSGQQGQAHDDFGRGRRSRGARTRSSQGHPVGAATVRIVQIRCYPAPGRDRTCVLQRTVVCGINRGDVSGLTGDAVANYMAQKISDSAVARTDRWWIVSDPWRAGAAAGAFESAQERMRQVLLGDPVQAVATKVGVPFPDIAGGIAAQIPLPVDAPFGFIKELLQFGGMAFGILAGFPLLTTACCKSILHDQLTSAIARGIRHGIEDLAAPYVSTPVSAAPVPDRSTGPGPRIMPVPASMSPPVWAAQAPDRSTGPGPRIMPVPASMSPPVWAAPARVTRRVPAARQGRRATRDSPATSAGDTAGRVANRAPAAKQGRQATQGRTARASRGR